MLRFVVFPLNDKLDKFRPALMDAPEDIGGVSSREVDFIEQRLDAASWIVQRE